MEFCKYCQHAPCICDDDEELEFDYDEWLELEDERMAECHCGAFVWSKNKGHFVQVADCVC